MKDMKETMKMKEVKQYSVTYSLPGEVRSNTMSYTIVADTAEEAVEKANATCVLTDRNHKRYAPAPYFLRVEFLNIARQSV